MLHGDVSLRWMLLLVACSATTAAACCMQRYNGGATSRYRSTVAGARIESRGGFGGLVGWYPSHPPIGMKESWGRAMDACNASSAALGTLSYDAFALPVCRGMRGEEGGLVAHQATLPPALAVGAAAPADFSKPLPSRGHGASSAHWLLKMRPGRREGAGSPLTHSSCSSCQETAACTPAAWLRCAPCVSPWPPVLQYSCRRDQCTSHLAAH
jgi:hypothetical protein